MNNILATLFNIATPLQQRFLHPKGKSKVFFKYFILFWGLFLLYSLFVHLNIENEPKSISSLMRLFLVCLFTIEILLIIHQKATYQHLLYLILAAGIIMRIGYTLYTPYYIRSHDLGTLSDATSRGHVNYIYYIYLNHALPDCNDIQYYQPPLFHILSAVVMQIYHLFFPATAANELMDTSKLVSCFASICSLITMKNILEELHCTKKGTVFAIAIVSFFPNYYLITGRVNNDSLAFLFLLLSWLYTIKWGRRHQKNDLYLLALFIGLGMMTKLSVAIVAFLAGPLMLYYLWKQFRAKNFKGTIIEYLIFLLICAPLGLWYSIRNLILFKQPLGYVLDITATYGITTLYRGNLSFWERFVSIPLKDLKLRPFIDVNIDSNINTYLLRNSLFGEFTFTNLEDLASSFTKVNAILILLSLIAGVFVLFREKDNKWLRFGPILVWFLTMLSYYSFNLKYPESCTMDYRYIPISSFCGSICIGHFFAIISEKTVHTIKRKLLNIGQFIILSTTIAFIAMSILFYTSIQ